MSEPPDPAASPPPLPLGLRWALLAHPAVQVVRFGTKLVLAWFLAPEEFGRAFLAGGLAFAAGHLALLGLDEAWVHTRNPGPRLSARLARVHRWSGAAAGTLTALAGAALTAQRPGDTLGLMLASLAPMVLLANLAVLPTAHLVRQQDWPRLFALDLLAVLCLSLATLLAVALGAGGWSLVIGWYANALVTLFLARRTCRKHHPLPPLDPSREDDPGQTLRYGRHLFGAHLSSFLGDRLDGWFVGFGLGPASLSLFGFYEKAQYMGSVLVSWAGQLAERALFRALSVRHQTSRLAPAFGTSLRMSLVWLIPAHVALALFATPIVALLLPPAWRATGPLLAVLSLAAGARCLDLVATTALKAGDRSASVARLGGLRLVLLLAALLVTLPRGDVRAMALAVLGVRLVSAALALRLCLLGLPPPREANLGAALAAVLLFSLIAVPTSLALGASLTGRPAMLLAGGVPLLGAAWLVSRLALDRAGLRHDLQRLRLRLAHSTAENGA